MFAFFNVLLYLCAIVIQSNAGRILAVYPFPSISHQVVFRKLTLELLRQGHELVVITTDPINGKGETTANLTEIDFHDMSYKTYRDGYLNSVPTKGDKSDWKSQTDHFVNLTFAILEEQLVSKEVQDIFNHKLGKFDLLIHESFYSPLLVFSHKLNIPTIQFSSFGSVPDCLHAVGAPTHPLLYPTSTRLRSTNLTAWEKIISVLEYIDDYFMLVDYEKRLDVLLKKLFGPDTPDISVLKNNVDLLFLNVHSIWENNRPVPPNVVYLGGLHQKAEQELPKDLKTYLDSSKNGVIYISFGTNVETSMLPPHKIQAMINVFSKLPYDVLWKWNQDELTGKTENIKISKWLPQSDLLRHPKIKMFITQGGLQSTDEAITAGVPVIGIPMIGDQWYNVEKYVAHGIGVHVDMVTLNEETFNNAIQEVLDNDSYRQNMQKLRSVMRDQPQSPLERAVWWTEYVLRHKGARHLRSPAANISWAQYLELELVCYLLLGAVSVILAIAFLTIKLYRIVDSQFREKIKSA